MSPEKLSRQAIRLAQRQSIKAGHPLTRDEILRLRIQTVEPWKRIFIILAGMVSSILPLWCYWHHAPVWIVVLFAAGSVFTILCGAFGRKTYLDRELKKFADDGSTRILDAIINGAIDSL